MQSKTWQRRRAAKAQSGKGAEQKFKETLSTFNKQAMTKKIKRKRQRGNVAKGQRGKGAKGQRGKAAKQLRSKKHKRHKKPQSGNGTKEKTAEQKQDKD